MNGSAFIDHPLLLAIVALGAFIVVLVACAALRAASELSESMDQRDPRAR
jgi:hypothetical protein